MLAAIAVGVLAAVGCPMAGTTAAWPGTCGGG